MRWLSCVLAVGVVACGQVKSDDVVTDGPPPDTHRDVDAGPCAACAPSAICDPDGPDVCVCPVGHAGDGTECVDVVSALDGRRLEVPCVNDTAVDACNPRVPAAWTMTAGGAPGTGYQVTIRVRGVVEQKTYEGGSGVGYWRVGGTPDATGYNVYRLRVGDVDHFLNAGMSEIRTCWPIDYTQSVVVRAGDAVLLETTHTDSAIIKNRDGNGTPVVVPGIPPAPDSFNGQFVQIDVDRVEPMP
jgi:hypothetical protein